MQPSLFICRQMLHLILKTEGSLECGRKTLFQFLTGGNFFYSSLGLSTWCHSKSCVDGVSQQVVTRFSLTLLLTVFCLIHLVHRLFPTITYKALMLQVS